MVEIISIGDELLIGQVVNTNASWMAEQLNMAGYDVLQITCVSDTGNEIDRALKEAADRAEVILMTGGLGPTKDDITKDVLCRFFNTELVINHNVLENIRSFFQRKGLPLTRLNHDQALVPASAKILENPIGTAPGLLFEQQGKVFAAMPGVPYEMKHIMESHILPLLSLRAGSRSVVHRTILTQGIGESFLAAIIKEWEESLAPAIKLAYLPSPGIVRLRLSIRSDDRKLADELLERKISELKMLVPQYIWGEGRETLEEVIGRLLKASGASVATAESCTGGYIAHRITSVPGSSGWFKGSVVAYDNKVKTEVLSVNQQLIIDHGAVSAEAVEAMARGAQLLLGTDYVIATSGIAGPDGGTPEKPVGLVWVAISGPDNFIISKKFMFGDQRDRNILRATNAALALLREVLVN